MSENNSNAVNAAQQTVVESAQSEPETQGKNSGADNAGTPAQSANADVATRGQTRSENRGFAQLRREKETAEAAAQKLISGLQGMGYTGNNPDELLEQLEARSKNLTVDQLRRQKEEAAAAVKNSPEYQRLERQLVSFGKEQDLRAVQQIDASITSLDDMPDEYFKLRAAGVSPKTAYFAVKQGEKPETKPEDIGRVSEGSGAESEYFTSDQLDRLTPRDLENKKIFEKAMKSLKHL